MTDKKHTTPAAETKDSVETVTGFWNQNSKKILIGLVAVIVVIGGYLGYKYLVSEPNEQKAAEAMFGAEQHFRNDSLRLALEGEAGTPGFLRVISQYGGTKAGNLAHLYAGTCYLKMGDFANAAKQLEQFSTSEPLMKARGKCLLADAYSESNKKEEAAKLYKEAGTTLEDDEVNSPEYLFRAGYLYESLGRNQEAIDAYKIIKAKYPRYSGADIDKYLGRLGYTE